MALFVCNRWRWCDTSHSAHAYGLTSHTTPLVVTRPGTRTKQNLEPNKHGSCAKVLGRKPFLAMLEGGWSPCESSHSRSEEGENWLLVWRAQMDTAETLAETSWICWPWAGLEVTQTWGEKWAPGGGGRPRAEESCHTLAGHRLQVPILVTIRALRRGGVGFMSSLKGKSYLTTERKDFIQVHQHCQEEQDKCNAKSWERIKPSQHHRLEVRGWTLSKC